MQTIKVDIINEKALNLLIDLELLELIRLHEEIEKKSINNASRYKGAMTKQCVGDLDNHLNDLRCEWE